MLFSDCDVFFPDYSLMGKIKCRMATISMTKLKKTNQVKTIIWNGLKVNKMKM